CGVNLPTHLHAVELELERDIWDSRDVKAEVEIEGWKCKIVDDDDAISLKLLHHLFCVVDEVVIKAVGEVLHLALNFMQCLVDDLAGSEISLSLELCRGRAFDIASTAYNVHPPRDSEGRTTGI
ncbi:MAG: hypothetical protein Q9191_008419, partial [Dirinaria sp. TL-2023a]